MVTTIRSNSTSHTDILPNVDSMCRRSWLHGSEFVLRCLGFQASRFQFQDLGLRVLKGHAELALTARFRAETQGLGFGV